MDTVEDAMEAKEELGKFEETDSKETSLQVKMSNLFGKLTRTLGWNPSPSKVISVQWSDYSLKTPLYTEGIFIVVPLTDTFSGDGEPSQLFEIVIHAEINGTTYSYSLLRTVTRQEAEDATHEYMKIFPCLVESCGKDFFNLSTLQKVLDVIKEKTGWTCAHVAVNFGFVESLKHEHVLRVLNEAETQRGLYPIHLAVENESEKLLSHLLNAGSFLEVFDKQGNSPVHLAASLSVSIIQALKPHAHKCVNTKNFKGETPLLIAAKSSKLENIKCLMMCGANLNHKTELSPLFDTVTYKEKLKVIENAKEFSHKDLSSGGSLLHWAKTRELLSAALDLQCDPNLLNDLGQSPLHIMVLRNRLQCLMTLLSRGADPNLVNNEGNSPLHLAASISSVAMVQALICFGANIDAVNKSGETPRHLVSTSKVEDRSRQVVYLLHSVGARRCRVKLASCDEGCSVDGSFNGVPLYEKPLLRSRWVFDDRLANTQISDAIKYQTLFKSGLKGRGRVLCLDGGGIKGLVLCQMLDVLRKVIGQSITDSFDWISGTSTGGFLALSLSLGKTVPHAQSLYYNLKDRVFVGTRPYDTNDLESILKEEFGESTMMCDITRAKVNITTTLADRLPADLHLFRNYEAPIDVLGIGESSQFVKPLPPHLQKIWQAARATGAAPTYFSSKDKYLDGGLVANNPVLDTLTEIEEWNTAVRLAGREDEVFIPTVVVSLGCGKSPVLKVDNVDLTMPSILEMRKGFQAVYNMFNLLVEQACASDGRIVDRARAWCSSMHVPFYRFNPAVSEDCSIDEQDDAKLARLMWEARSYMISQFTYLAQLKELLSSNKINSLHESGAGPYPPPRRSAPSTPCRKSRSRRSSLITINHSLTEENDIRKFALRESHSEYALSGMNAASTYAQTMQQVSIGDSMHEAYLAGEGDSFHSGLDIDISGNENIDPCATSGGEPVITPTLTQKMPLFEIELSGENSPPEVVNFELETNRARYTNQAYNDDNLNNSFSDSS